MKQQALAALVLWVGGCMGNSAVAAGADGNIAAIVDSALAKATPRLLAALEWASPLQTRLPARSVICSAVTANLSSSVFALPTTTDPDIDSMAAVAANPANSNPDTVRIQAALNSCHPGGVVKLGGRRTVRCVSGRRADAPQWRNPVGGLGRDAVCVQVSCRLHSRRVGCRRRVRQCLSPRRQASLAKDLSPWRRGRPAAGLSVRERSTVAAAARLRVAPRPAS